MSSNAPAPRCWVCGGQNRDLWRSGELHAVACRSCGHVVAEHPPQPELQAIDYHLGYEQNDFVTALAATRRRQAGVLLDALAALESPPRSLFDFGCGRGFLLEVASARGGLELGGGDVSELALELLAERGLPALRLDTERPFEQLDLARLPFMPEALTFLDVLEHFPGDLAARLHAWLGGLPAGVRFVVIKVPVRDGLMFSLADVAWRAGVRSLGLQLFQAGTFPPHYQYFSRRSLAGFVRALELEPLAVLDDLDFEPEQLARRLAGSSPGARALRRIAPALGWALGATARTTGRADSRIVIAARRAAASAGAARAAG